MMLECHTCGDEFEWVRTQSGGHQAKYCSNLCRKKKRVSCSGCGETTYKTDWQIRTQLRFWCSPQCRSANSGPLRSPLPDDHWARWYGAASPWTPPKQPKRVESLCGECGVWFVTTQVAKTCSRRCSRRAARRRRKAREHNAPGDFKWLEVIELFLKFDRCCAYCDQPIDGQPDPDHVVPLSRGGHNDISNILPSCHLCNTDKNDLTLGEWAADRESRGKPPRRYSWSRDDLRYRHVILRPPTQPSYRDRRVAS